MGEPGVFSSGFSHMVDFGQIIAYTSITCTF